MKRTIAMFEELNEYDETAVDVLVNELIFTAKRTENATLPLIIEKEPCKALIKTKKGKTAPPSLYTEGTLITAMKNCGKELEDIEKEIMKEAEGIGMEATRANVRLCKDDRLTE